MIVFFSTFPLPFFLWGSAACLVGCPAGWGMVGETAVRDKRIAGASIWQENGEKRVKKQDLPVVFPYKIWRKPALAVSLLPY